MAGRPFAATIVRQSHDDGDMPVVERLNPLGLRTTRTAETEAQYIATFRSLLKMSSAPCDVDDGARLHHVVAWFSERNGLWSPRTVRAYRAALIFVVEVWRDSGVENDPVRVRCVLELAAKASPRPRPASAPPRTSARKRVYVALDEHNLLVADLARRSDLTSHLVAGMLAFGARLALRPCEWRTAKIVGEFLVVACAKRSNGRGIDVERAIDLRDLREYERRGLERFVTAIRAAAAEASSWQTLHERLAKAVHRTCVRLGIPPIALYSLRHQSLATAKLFMTPAEVAAFAGHASVETARRYYAHRRGGWRRDPRVRPIASLVAKVRAPSRGAAQAVRLNL